MAEVIVDSSNFVNEVLESPIPVLVDFWATWCGPCKMIAPHVAKIAQTFEGKVKVCKIDVDQAGDIAQSFNVSSIPTLIMFRDGEPVASRIGGAPYQVIESFVNSNLN